jgi:nitrous oxide reductase accessory protein NosL
VRRRPRAVLAVAALAIALVAAAAAPAGESFVAPGPRDRCPVCGMFVARHPDWLAEVVLADGRREVFDGAKDLFKFLADPGRYAPGRSRADVRAIWVTDYYAVEPVDARAAFYVSGSDVNGPMGRELVPFRAEADAREFLRDHRGERILRFDEVTGAVMGALDGTS